MIDYAPCYYCGMPGIALDHVPPIAVASRLLEMRRVTPDQFVLVPACTECNGALHAKALVTPQSRREHIRLRLRLKLEKLAEWTERELAEIGPIMKREIRAYVKTKDRLEWRLGFEAVLE